jgi:hypothetical protein
MPLILKKQRQKEKAKNLEAANLHISKLNEPPNNDPN